MAVTARPVCGVSTATARFARSGQHLTVFLSGELDASSTPEIETAILGHVEPGDDRLWIDLSAVSFCDSSGLKLLFLLFEQARTAETAFVLLDPSEAVERVIGLCDPNHVITIQHETNSLRPRRVPGRTAGRAGDGGVANRRRRC